MGAELRGLAVVAFVLVATGCREEAPSPRAEPTPPAEQAQPESATSPGTSVRLDHEPGEPAHGLEVGIRAGLGVAQVVGQRELPGWLVQRSPREGRYGQAPRDLATRDEVRRASSGSCPA